MSLSPDTFSQYNCFSVQLAPGGRPYEIPFSQTWHEKLVTITSTDSSLIFNCNIQVDFSRENPIATFTLEEKGREKDSSPYRGTLNNFKILKAGLVQCSLKGTVDLRNAFFSIKQN